MPYKATEAGVLKRSLPDSSVHFDSRTACRHARRRACHAGYRCECRAVTNGVRHLESVPSATIRTQGSESVTNRQGGSMLACWPIIRSFGDFASGMCEDTVADVAFGTSVAQENVSAAASRKGRETGTIQLDVALLQLTMLASSTSKPNYSRFTPEAFRSCRPAIHTHQCCAIWSFNSIRSRTASTP